MQDGQQDESTISGVREPTSSRGTAGESGADAPGSSHSVPFRLIADFVVEIDTAVEYLKQPDLMPEERRLLLTVLTTPEALNQVCRLAIVSDLETEPGLFVDRFFGPQSEDILAVVMPYLSGEDQIFWSRLQREFPENLSNYLSPMFCEFETVLRRVVVVDASTGEAIPQQVRRERVL